MLDGDFLDHWYNCIAMYVFSYLFRLTYELLVNKNTNLLFSAIAWLIIPLDVKIEHGWFIFHSWNLFVAICAVPRLVLYTHILFNSKRW